MAYTLITTLTVGAGGATNFDFTSLPQNFTDLLIITSARTSTSSTKALLVSFNGDTSNRNTRGLYGNGSTYTSYNGTSPVGAIVTNSVQTASTFGNAQIYIPNYASGIINKASAADGVDENNATSGNQFINANLWTSTAPITRVTLTPEGADTLVQYSTASLYGISTGTEPVVKGSGGTIYSFGGYIYHVFNATGTFTATSSFNGDVLVIGGGGGGQSFNSGVAWGNGGASGFVTTSTAQSFTASTSYAVTIGNGGAAGTGSGGMAGTAGGTSSLIGGTLSISAAGGQGGNTTSSPNYSQYGAGNVNAGSNGFGGIGITSSWLINPQKLAGGGSNGNANFASRPADDGSFYGGGLSRSTAIQNLPVANTGGGGQGGGNTADGMPNYNGQAGATGLVIVRYQ